MPQTPELKPSCCFAILVGVRATAHCLLASRTSAFRGPVFINLNAETHAQKIGQVPLTPYGVTHSIGQRPPSIPHSFPVETSWQKSCTATIWSRGVSSRR